MPEAKSLGFSGCHVQQMRGDWSLSPLFLNCWVGEWGQSTAPDGLERQYRFPVVIRRYLAFEFLDRDIYFDAFHIFLHGSFSFIDFVRIRSYRFGPVAYIPDDFKFPVLFPSRPPSISCYSARLWHPLLLSS